MSVQTVVAEELRMPGLEGLARWERLTANAVGCALPWSLEAAEVVIRTLGLCCGPKTILMIGTFGDPVDAES